MRIYGIHGDFDRFDTCTIDFDNFVKRYNCKSWEAIFGTGGTSKADGWKPRKMIRDNDYPLGDYVSCFGSDVLIIEKKAINKLASVMGNYEVLPLECDFGDYWLINILDVLDCVDYEQSKFVTFPTPHENGKPHIMCFQKYEFLKEKIGECHLFKIVDIPQSAIFADEIFIAEVEKQGITGFKFDLVWEG